LINTQVHLTSWELFIGLEISIIYRGIKYKTYTINAIFCLILESKRRVWRYQRGNQNLYIEEEQTTQWPKEKVQKDKQRSTKYTYKTKDRVTWTPLKTGGELRCSGRVSSSCSTSDTRHVNLGTNNIFLKCKLYNFRVRY
jgi:hypothetical protein